MGVFKVNFNLFLIIVILNCVNSFNSEDKEVKDVKIERSVFDEDLYEQVLDSDLCEQQLAFLSNNSLRFQFFDASGKLPSGVQTGNLNDLGDYYQCLNINHQVNDLDIEGKYCMIAIPAGQEIQIPGWPELPDLPEIPWPNITFPGFGDDNDDIEQIMMKSAMLRQWARIFAGIDKAGDSRMSPVTITNNLSTRFAVCIPKVCSTEQALGFSQDRIPLLNLTYNEMFCRLPNDKPYAAADYVAFAIFGTILGITILSTVYDLYYHFALIRRGNPIYTCFSVYTNTRRFLTFNTSPGALECVDGIRAISMMWVIVGHTYLFSLFGYVHNIAEVFTWLRKFSSTWVNSAPITVDTFFLLSGILCVYTTIGKISRGRFVRSVYLFYFNRLLRMFPLLAAVVLLQASIFNHVSDGPNWQIVGSAVQNCRNYWWSALLHVQNYVNPLEFCLSQTWYLSVDVQLYFACPFILIWLFGSKSVAWIILTVIILLSLVSSSLYSFFYNFSAALIHPNRIGDLRDYMTIYYINTLARAPPFFIGMAYGYLLYLWKERKVTIPKFHVIFLWILSFTMMAFCIFSIYPVMQLDHDAQLLDNFLNAYMRAVWGLALGWLIVACVKGYGGPINWFLCLRMWKLPARMSFAMYLVHFSIIMVSNGSWMKTYYFTNGNTLSRFASDLLFTFIGSFILSILIDAPFSTIQKMINGGGKKRPPKMESQENIENGRHSMKTRL